jgi:hypothetical protein
VILNPHTGYAATAAVSLLLLSALASWLATWFLSALAHSPARILRRHRIRAMPPFLPAERVGFTTEDGRRFFVTDGRPLRLELTRPCPLVVYAHSLPLDVSCHGGTALTVEAFTDEGFTISRQRPGTWVEGWVGCDRR